MLTKQAKMWREMHANETNIVLLDIGHENKQTVNMTEFLLSVYLILSTCYNILKEKDSTDHWFETVRLCIHCDILSTASRYLSCKHFATSLRGSYAQCSNLFSGHMFFLSYEPHVHRLTFVFFLFDASAVLLFTYSYSHRRAC